MKLYRKPIPIYKFGDNLKESDGSERLAFIRKSRSIVGLPLFEMKGLMTVWKDVQTKNRVLFRARQSEYDKR